MLAEGDQHIQHILNVRNSTGHAACAFALPTMGLVIE
jgi:hypothetical protein